MADYVQVANELNRMCDYHCGDTPCTDPDGNVCPLRSQADTEAITSTDCYIYAIDCPEQAQRLVINWAADHPVPVYPTWEDALRQLGVIVGTETTFELYHRQISKKHAEMLGIKPKEGE